MPNRAQRRSGESTEFEKMGFRITVKTPHGPAPYEIKISDMSAKDEFDFHKITGYTFFEAFEHISSYVVAAFVWLERRKANEPRLSFDEVAEEVTVGDLESLKTFGEDDDEPETQVQEPAYNGKNPEPSGGPSEPSSQGSPLSTG